MRCLPKWGKSSAGITRFSLVKAVNKGGITYTKVRFKMERPLTDDEIAKIAPLVLNVKAISQTLTLEADESTQRHSGIVHDLACVDCGAAITGEIAQFSVSRYGRPLCADCQRATAKSA